MKYILVLICILFGLTIYGQKKSKNVRAKIITVESDTIQIDTLSISSFYFKVYNPQNEEVDLKFYKVDFSRSELIFNKNSDFIGKEVKVEYLNLPDFLTRNYAVFDKELIVPKITDESRLYSYQSKNTNKSTKPFDGLYTSGSLSRGVTMGNNQDAVVNSNFNLQIEGNLSKSVGIRASITDNEIPLQEGGYTQRIDEFDKVFIELFSKSWKLKAGDIDLQNKDSYFMRFYKKISGVAVNAKIDHHIGETNVFASGAMVKGRYHSFNFTGIDGNQGPYKIMGPNNEQFILMVSGSERVYANGVLLKRGENFDYTIDYNTSEIIFTTIYAINSNLRITIEYQIADRNYTRFLTFDGAEYKSDKLKIGIKYFNESDSKNKTVHQDLTDEQKQILANAGDDKTKMVAPSEISVAYAENKILYKKTIINNQEVFVFSNNPKDELYQVNFTYVGENRGDYLIETTLASGRVYSFVPEVNQVKQGSYLPVIQLVAPEKLQMFTLDLKYNPGKRTNLTTEIALSDNDQNLFSNLDNDNNKGLASKLSWQQLILDKKWKLKSNIDYEFIDDSFKTVERFRNIEFSRDWNIKYVGDQSLQKQQFLRGGFSFLNDSIGFVNYNYENLIFGDNYKGSKHSIGSNLYHKNTRMLIDFSVLNSDDQIDKTAFYRLYSGAIHEFKKSWAGVKFNLENNNIEDKLSERSSIFSHSYIEMEGYYGIGDSTKIFAEVGYNFRSTDSVRIGQLENVSKANTFFIKSKLIQNKNTDLGLFVNYRTVKNVNIDDERSLNSRVNYRQGFWHNMVVLQTLYETQAGNLPQQEFIYIEVEPGKGFYEWIDFNGNGIQELDEFVIAKFQDQAKYVRVLLPQVKFIKTNQNKFTQSINLNAMRWQKASGVKKILSHFSDQTYFLINSKTKREGSKLNLNPFAYDDENLLSLDLNFKNSFFYNRGLQHYSMVYTYINSRKRSIFVFGNQDVNFLTHQIQMIHKFGKFWLLDFRGGNNKSISESMTYSNRNYEIIDHNFYPKISYLYSKNSRMEAFYKYKDKKNQIEAFEELKMHVFGVNFQYANKQKFSINANVNLYFNSFEGNQNSPVAYQMLEGLQPGTNFTWLLNLQKRLTSYLDLNLNYFGRKSESSKTIHTGSIQLRATF